MAKAAVTRPRGPRLDPPPPKKAPPPPKDEVEFVEVEQRSDEWYAARLGIPTASRFSDVMAGGDGKSRDAYLYQLAGEVLFRAPIETFQSRAMLRGIEMEPKIREWYGRTRFVDLEPIGFVRRTCRVALGDDFVIGCSPDSHIAGTRKGLEIKTEKPELLVRRLERGAAGFPSEHRAQLQGTMLVCDWEEMDLVVGYGEDDTPKAMFTAVRDDAYIARLRDELERFSYDLKMLVEKIRKGQR